MHMNAQPSSTCPVDMLTRQIPFYQIIPQQKVFREVIKKHKLKFRLEGVFDREYSYGKKVNYGFFAELCKTNSVNVAVVLGPPPGAAFSNEEFETMLSAIFEDERISFQLINYTDITKQYKFLNIALDITLLKNKEMYG